MNTAKLTLASLLLASGALAPGCVRDTNARPTLGGTLTTNTFAPTTTNITTADTTPGLDRSRWPARVFVVPVDGTAHGPARHRDLQLTDDTARQQALMPTLESSLELSGDTGTHQGVEGLLAPLAAVAEVALLPIDLAINPPWAERQSPRELYKRSTQGGWSNAPVPAPIDAFPVPTPSPPSAASPARSRTGSYTITEIP